jgi:hypothetical protein
MIKLVKTISTELGNGGRRLIKILGMGRKDIQTPYQAAPFGFDSNPIRDMVAVQANTGEMGKTAIIGYINVEQLAEVGESRIFSTDDAGVEKAYIWLKNDENIEIGGNADFMVRYSALETAFNQLKNDFNAHVHPGVVSGPSSTAVTTPSTADISPAKIEDIKTR